MVEAALRSGSLISARLAGELNRLVFAVPGSPLDPRAAGANNLLKQGAILVTGVGDVVDAIRPLLGSGGRLARRFLSAPYPFGWRVGAAFGLRWPCPPPKPNAIASWRRWVPSPAEVDDIIRHTGLIPAQVFVILLELDLAGRLERHSGGAVSLLLPDS